MKGNLSKLALIRPNYTGVLHQEGRVHVDQDPNAEHFITARIRERMAQDIIGTAVAAVPAGQGAGFRVTQAQATALGVIITLTPGRLWLDGHHIELPGAGSIVLPAEYYAPLVQDPQRDTSTIAAGVRDAVVLDAWEEALNAFQDPTNLLEPALGGVDTTERTSLFFRLKLFRLDDDENCRTIADDLNTDPNDLGRLTVTASPVVIIGGDCPVDTGGGYTGLEHYLYRIEIDTPAAGQARFKWSRFNGGLVGRGTINLTGDTVTIVANDQMINRCGLTSFYLEALTQAGPHQPWEIVFTAQASLASDGVLTLTQMVGAWPAPANVSVFFRLWDGVRNIADFTAATDLENGIRLEFDAPVPATGVTNYRTGDYWTFMARAAGSNFDPAVWPNDAPPEGIRYHRAPLAEITWPSIVPAIAVAPDDIEDCRHTFPPLTRLRVCCTYTVGDGLTTFGDFNAIQEAVNALPANGGEICLMPGTHRANVRIRNRHDIRIHGCGIHTRVIPHLQNLQEPIFHILDSQNIELDHIDLFTPQGNAVLAEGTNAAGVSEIEIVRCRIVAGLSCIVVANGASIGICYNRLRVIDRAPATEAILLLAEGAWIERNDLGVVPEERTPPPGDEPDPQDDPRPEDPCVDPGDILASPHFISAYQNMVFTADLLIPPLNPFLAIGGIRVAGGSERITILENMINGGRGNGITLGSGILLTAPVEPQPGPGVEVAISSAGLIQGTVSLNGAPVDDIIFSFRRSDGSGGQYFASSTNDGIFYVLDAAISPGPYRITIETPGFVIANISTGPGGTLVPSTTLFVAIRPTEQRTVGGLTIEEVLIQRNDILHMGLSGIGTIGPQLPGTSGGVAPGGATILEQFGTIVFQLEIDGNHIRRCVRNRFNDVLLAIAAIRGLGGISLGLCDELIISANRLEQNGLSHIDPIAGIFVALVDHIEIHDNRIENNGPFQTADAQQVLRLGIRGGVVVRALARLDHVTEVETVDNLAALDQPAARVFDNVIRQPVGQALQLAALGPVAVQNNFMSSARNGASPFEILAGVVLILNRGAREVVSAAGSAAPPPVLVAEIPAVPDGKMLFSDNQVRFGQLGRSFFGQLIVTLGDLGYDSNQADYLGPGIPIGDTGSTFANTGLLADTVRATDSRFKEGRLPPRSPVISLIATGTTFNITSQNQGDHCIFVFGGAEVDAPNQVLDNIFCPELRPGIAGTLVANGLVTNRG